MLLPTWREFTSPATVRRPKLVAKDSTFLKPTGRRCFWCFSFEWKVTTGVAVWRGLAPLRRKPSDEIHFHHHHLQRFVLQFVTLLLATLSPPTSTRRQLSAFWYFLCSLRRKFGWGQRCPHRRWLVCRQCRRRSRAFGCRKCSPGLHRRPSPQRLVLRWSGGGRLGRLCCVWSWESVVDGGRLLKNKNCEILSFKMKNDFYLPNCWHCWPDQQLSQTHNPPFSSHRPLEHTFGSHLSFWAATKVKVTRRTMEMVTSFSEDCFCLQPLLPSWKLAR